MALTTDIRPTTSRRAMPPAALAAMGIVFGDIGTSPLYTLQVAVKSASGDGAISPAAVLGIVSLIFWSLIIVIGVLGVVGIAKAPGILAALSPLPAIIYLTHAGPLALVVIGGAFLAVTGGEAFYADMGHFGPLPIRLAWFIVALPALTLNYFGQGGLLLTQPEAIANSFYQLAPEWTHYALVALATAATVIASQSIISGAYSLTSQAIQLGFLPRMNIIHTAGHEIGQIYVPLVNWLLALGTLAAVVGFGSSDALAGAFGIAVSLLMAITTILATFVALQWKHNPFLVYAVNGCLLALDLLFVASTSTKLFEGGWFPLAISFIIAFLMMTWRKGQEILDQVRLEIREKSQEFIARIKAHPPNLIPGTAVVLGRMKQGVPLPLTHNVNFNHVLHERVLLVAIEMTETPRVDDAERVIVTALSDRIARLELKFGFMEKADVPQGLQVAVAFGQIAACNLAQVTYFTGHETIIATRRKTSMVRWRKALFAVMHHNAQQPGAYFNIPSAQVMEIGVEFEI